MAIMVWPAIIAGTAGLLGGALGNRAARQESGRNRQFQERMRNTQWQAGVADMEAAGLNPALAYSQGPAASPGGSMASQQDVISPAVSSAMQMKRMTADLKQIRATTQKVQNEGREAEARADRETATNFAYGLTRGTDGTMQIDRGAHDGYSWLTRNIRSGVLTSEARARREGSQALMMQPLGQFADRMGEMGPALGLLSQLLPGGMLRRARVPRNIKGKTTGQAMRDRWTQMKRRIGRKPVPSIGNQIPTRR